MIAIAVENPDIKKPVQAGRLKAVTGNLFRTASAVFFTLSLAGCDSLAPGPVIVAGAAGITENRGTPKTDARATDIYRLKPGDEIEVFVFDNPDLSKTAVVSPDGRLHYPLAGTIEARGRKVNDVRDILRSRFANTIVGPQVTVSLKTIKPYRIFVTGEVVQPGTFDLVDPVTVIQAISLAGGFTAFADRRRVLVYNPGYSGGERRLFDYDRFLSDPLSQDVVLVPGDTIIVH